MGDSWIDKIIILTSPVGLMFLLFGLIIDLWQKHIWCSKRYYYEYYHYLVTKRIYKKGIDFDQRRYFMRWINNNPDNLCIEKYKKLLQN